MQIHELNNYVGSLGDSAYLPIDNGQDTGKLAYSDLFSTGERTMLWSGSVYQIGGTIDLSESIRNFEYIEIFYTAGNIYLNNSLLVPVPLAQQYLELNATINQTQLSTPNFRSMTVKLSHTDTRLAIAESSQYQMSGTTPTISVDSPASLYIYRVDGINTAARNKSVVEVKQVTLDAADWADDEQTVTVPDVLTSNSVIISPDPTSYTDYTNAGITCTAQANNSLTFKCTTTPSSDIVVNVAVIG